MPPTMIVTLLSAARAGTNGADSKSTLEARITTTDLIHLLPLSPGDRLVATATGSCLTRGYTRAIPTQRKHNCWVIVRHDRGRLRRRRLYSLAARGGTGILGDPTIHDLNGQRTEALFTLVVVRRIQRVVAALHFHQLLVDQSAQLFEDGSLYRLALRFRPRIHWSRRRRNSPVGKKLRRSSLNSTVAAFMIVDVPTLVC